MPNWIKAIMKKKKDKKEKEKKTGKHAHEPSAGLKKFVLPTSPAKDDD